MGNTISKKYIVDYITSNYGQMKHDIYMMHHAIIATAKSFKLDKKSLFHYIIERTDGIVGATSYGFDTAYGREIRDRFEYEYYNN